MATKTPLQDQSLEKDTGFAQMSRRRFFGFASAASGIALLGSACNKDDDDDDTVNLGSGDTGILNYAYALEQLEAAFYISVMANPYSGMSSYEMSLLTDIRDHEIAHREFFKTALAGNAIPGLKTNFSSVDFGSRTSVLNTAKAFEDLGVAAYNGAGALLQSADFLTVAGKIVSVEARHAALVRDLLSNGTFVGADVVDQSNGLEKSKTPPMVLSVASNFLITKLNGSNLPS